MKRLIEQTLCGHEGSLNPATGSLLDGMKPHPVGEKTGYNRGGAETFEGRCPGGTSREVTVDYEAAEKALFLHDGNFSAKVWDALHYDTKAEWREMAKVTVDAALEAALKHWEGHWLASMPPKELSYRDEPEKTIYRAVCLLADFDAIWRRYYDAADDNNTTTKEQLWEVVYGEKKEEE